MGENGAGKSTLMKVLGGAYQPDEGTILIDGRAVTLRSVRDARRLGIALIHQELMLAPNLDITANIFLGNEAPAPRLFAPVRPRRARSAAPPRCCRGSDCACRRHARLGADHGADADGRDRQGAVARRPHHRDGRADLVADRRRIGTPVCHRPAAARRGARHRLHLAPDGGGARSSADRITVLRDGRYVGDLPRDGGDARSHRGHDGRAGAERPLFSGPACTACRATSCCDGQRDRGARVAGRR